MLKYNYSLFLYLLLLWLSASCLDKKGGLDHKDYYYEKDKPVTIVDDKSEITKGLKDKDFQSADCDTLEQLVGSPLFLDIKIILNAKKVLDLMLKSKLTQNLKIKLTHPRFHHDDSTFNLREMIKKWSLINNKYAKNNDEYILYDTNNGLTEKYKNIDNQYILTDFTYKDSGVDFHLDRDNDKVILSSELGDLEIDTNDNCFGKKNLDLDKLFTILNKIYFGNKRKKEFGLTDLRSSYFMALFESFVTNSKCKFIYPKNGYFKQTFYASMTNLYQIDDDKKDYIRVRDLIKKDIKKDLINNPTKKVYITKLVFLNAESSCSGMSTFAKKSLNTKLNDILEQQDFDSKDEIIQLLNDMLIFKGSLHNAHATLMCYFVDINKVILIDSNNLDKMKNLDVGFLSRIDREEDTLINADSYGYQQNGNICNIASSINAILFAELVEQNYETIIRLIKDEKYNEIGYLLGDIHKKYRKQLQKIFISNIEEFECL